MDTTDHFISLAKLLPISVPFFVWVTGLLAVLCVYGICRELFILRSRPFPKRGVPAFLAISALPFALLWFGARMMHESVRDAQVWPSVVIWSVVLATLAAGVFALWRVSAWKGAFVGVFALQFWLVLSTAFIAELSVCGDYFRYLISTMNQPIPTVTDADVERVVPRDFPANQHAEVMALLAEYGRESWQRDPARVRLAVLKLSEGNLDELRSIMSTALSDYRDVLGPAEYPAYIANVWSGPEDAEQLKLHEQIIKQDWQQYESWLYR